MQTVTARIRIFSVAGAPTIAMSATATATEVTAIVKNIGLREKPVILRASPIQDHIKFALVRRPSNFCGMDGEVDKVGNLKPGLIALLERIYLSKFIENTLQNIPVKKCLMLFRSEKQMADVHDFVREKLPGCKDPATNPYVMNHGGLGPITTQSIIDRRNEIKLFLSTRYISCTFKFGSIGQKEKVVLNQSLLFSCL